MTDPKSEFVDFLLDCEALRFGDFVTKSGRHTPYFVNFGAVRSGAQIAALGRWYADAILAADLRPDVLFGPAYKGIPIAVATAAALAGRGHDVGFCFDRKEAKDHGEGGRLVGHRPSDGDRVVIVEDVTTAGTSVRDSIPLLRGAADVSVVGLVVALDRKERGATERGALTELADEYGLAALSIATIDDVLEHVGAGLDADLQARITAYRQEYGAR